MKIGIFDPYLNTLGGGERYILTIASFLSKENEVTLFWDEPSIIDKASSLFNISLDRVKTQRDIFASGSLIEKLLITRKLDVIFYLSDGSIPFLFGKKNILLFQFPVNWVNGKTFLTRVKFLFITSVICYSKFVKNYLDKTFDIKSIVISPSINSKFKKEEKQNIILNVGRFTKAMNTKKQEVLIEQFKKYSKTKFKDWKFVLIGSNLPKDSDFVERLKKNSQGYPIEILNNLEFKRLQNFYGKAKIYWHATGFEENLEEHPERAEHFGISTIEAMALGVVPVVFSGGGQREIIKDGENGFLWNTTKELVDKTFYLIKNPEVMSKVSEKAISESRKYSEREFNKKIKEII